MGRLEGRVALVTGASRGIGAAVARSLAAEGMMRPQDVADIMLFVLTRPRERRFLEVAFRPVSEASWG